MTRAWYLSLLSALPAQAAAEETRSELPPPSADLLAPRPHRPGLPSIHPAILLKDAAGGSALESGAPVSAAKTCDGCHDVRWIEAHDYHATMAAESFARGPALLTAGNCFLCHLAQADHEGHARALAAGRPEEIGMAALAGTGLLASVDGRWRWRREAFRPDGTVTAATLGLGRPSDRACGFCHGVVYEDHAPLQPASGPGQLLSDREGAIFSGQRISDSALNLAGKGALTRPWDVHKERMVSCANCHFSPNHPAYAYGERAPAHLQFDARRLALTEYLRRPDHRFARGPGADGAGPHGGNLRGCDSCHDAPKVHRWLPRAERHFAALACETCHVPMAYAGAVATIDWTVLDVAGRPRVERRGVERDGFLTGFRPPLLPRAHDGTGRLAPNNLVTTFRWIEQKEGKPRPVPPAVLERAFLAGDRHRPELVNALDRNGDGKLEADELCLDTAARVEAARALLAAAGVAAPAIVGVVESYELHHGTSPGRFATRDCASCHATNSRLDAPTVVASALPFGVTPVLASTAGTLSRDDDGRLLLYPAPGGLHVFGHTRSGFLDGLGALLFAGAIAGAGGHAFLRVRGARRQARRERQRDEDRS